MVQKIIIKWDDMTLLCEGKRGEQNQENVFQPKCQEVTLFLSDVPSPYPPFILNYVAVAAAAAKLK